MSFLVNPFISFPVVGGGGGADISGFTATGNSISLGGIISTPRNFRFKPDGTEVYVISSATNQLAQYSLSTAWDLSTASYTSTSNAFTSLVSGSLCYGFDFNSAGTRLHVISDGANAIRTFNTSTAWDFSTLTYSGVTFSVSTQDSNGRGMAWGSGGVGLYMVGASADKVFKYNSTAYNVGSLSFTAGQEFSVASQETAGIGFWVSEEEDVVLVCGLVADTVFQYTMSTAGDASTGSYSGTSIDVSGTMTNPSGVYMKPDYSTLYILDTTSDSIYEYA